VFGIFSGDGLRPTEGHRVSEGDVAKLIDIFPTQSIDFYGALRSRLYDEQVSAFIRTVGLEKLSTRIINSNEKPPEFISPDFGLNHLIEVGNSIVREQRRIHELRLVEEYNQGIKVRSSEPADHPPTTPQSSSPIGQSSNSRLTFDVVSEINRILSQGDRVGIEYVDKRRFQTGSWTCYGTFEGNASDAIAALETCLMEHDRDYIRLVGISKQSRSRLTEMMVQRS